MRLSGLTDRGHEPMLTVWSAHTDRGQLAADVDRGRDRPMMTIRSQAVVSQSLTHSLGVVNARRQPFMHRHAPPPAHNTSLSLSLSLSLYPLLSVFLCVPSSLASTTFLPSTVAIELTCDVMAAFVDSSCVTAWSSSLSTGR